MNEIIFDMRCLQDEAYGARGIGKVASAIFSQARRNLPTAQEWRLVGLTDAQLPDLQKPVLEQLDEARHTTGDIGASKNTTFVSLSPMTHDPLFIARLLNDSRVFAGSIFYDFIPLSIPEHYLPGPTERLVYSVKRYWLSRYQFFGAISSVSAEELQERLAISSAQIATIGAPIDGSFKTNTEKRVRKTILVVGGGDKRKNVECAIRAHGQSQFLNGKDIQLVVTGIYPKSWIRELRDLHMASGGRSKLLRFTGHIEQLALVDLYHSAICVACMSKAEGFSLPVIEAIACGTPVIASDIAAHRELIQLPHYLVACDAAREVQLRMETLAQDDHERTSFVNSHRHIAQTFTEENVAHLFWSSLLKRREEWSRCRAKPSVSRGRRPKIAFVTPLPPARSGVADYSAVSLKEIARLADIEVFTNTNAPKRIEGVDSFWPITSLPYVSRQFDRVVSVLGNSHFHLDIFKHLMRFGGACIQHDNRLLGFYSILLGRQRAEQTAERELQRPLHDGELDRWLADEATLEATFLGEITEVSNPLFLHSRRTGDILQSRFAKQATVLPFAMYRNWSESELNRDRKYEARSRLGLSSQEISIISLGFVQNSKAPRECIHALEMLRSWNIPAKLYFVGEVGRDLDDLNNLSRKLGISDYVFFTNEYTSEEHYRDFLAAADLAIQLRTHLFGGLSGALLDCIAAGLPTIANADLADSMDAPPYVQRVNNRPSPVLIANAAADIINCGSDWGQRQEDLQAFSDTHNFTTYARQLMEGLSLEVTHRSSAQGMKSASRSNLY